MPRSAYPQLNFELFYIAEDPSSEPYQSRIKRLKLTDDEIRAVRTALQRITRRRVLDAGDAEDLVQDTLLTLITCKPDGKLRKGILAWSRGILRNKVGNYYRKSERQALLKRQSHELCQGDPESTVVANQEASVSHRELRSIIEAKLAEFDPDVREAMELLLSGLKAGEIVELLRPESYQNVINRLYRGRKKLARELMKCGFTPGYRNKKNRAGARRNREHLSRKVS